MTQGGICEHRTVGRMTTGLSHGHVLSRVVSRLIRISVLPLGLIPWLLNKRKKICTTDKATAKGNINVWVSVQ